MGHLISYKTKVDSIPKWIGDWAKEKEIRKAKMRVECQELRKANSTK